MTSVDPNAPVLDWPLDRGEPGREVWYGLAGPADGSAAFWYRYTLLSTTDGYQEARLWAALTDTDGSTRFVSESLPLEMAALSDEPFRYAVADGELTSRSARGRLDDVSWDLSYEPDSFVFTPLRSERLTSLLARVASTGRHWSRNESVRASGEVTVGERTLTFDDAPAHQGHTLGSNPPPRWRWLQCNAFDDDSVALECLDLDGRLSMCLRRDGEVHELNRLHHIVGPRASETTRNGTGRWEFSGAGDGVEVDASVVADPDHWQRVTYMTPDGSPRYNAHCSLSAVTLRYRVDGGPERTLTSDAGRAEWVDTDEPVSGHYRPGWG